MQGMNQVFFLNPTDRPPAGDPKKLGTDNFFRVALCFGSHALSLSHYIA